MLSFGASICSHVVLSVVDHVSSMLQITMSQISGKSYFHLSTIYATISAEVMIGDRGSLGFLDSARASVVEA